MNMAIDYKANDILQKLHCFCLINGFKPIGNNDEMLSNFSSSISAQKGAVKIYADAFLNSFRLITSTGSSESCALTDLRIEGGSLIINGKEFVI